MGMQNLDKFVKKVESWLPAVEESLSRVGWNGEVKLFPRYGGRLVEIYTNRKICSLQLLRNYHVVCYIPYPSRIIYTERRLKLHYNASRLGKRRLPFKYFPVLCSQVHLIRSIFMDEVQLGRNSVYSYDVSYWAKRNKMLHKVTLFLRPPLKIVFASECEGVLAINKIRVPFSSPASLKEAIKTVVDGCMWL